MWCASHNSSILDHEAARCAVVTCDERLAVVKGKNVNIYHKESLHELLKFSFGSEVNSVCWTGKGKSGDFLLVAEHSGSLHTVHMKSKRVINSEKVYQTYNDVSSTFTQLIYVEGSCTLFILGSGQLHSFMNIDYEALDKALCEGAMQKVVALKKNVIHSIGCVSPNISRLVPDVCKEHIAVFMLGEEDCLLSKLVYRQTEQEWMVDIESPLYGYGGIRNGFKITPQYLLTLTSKGHLLLWNALTCTAVKIWSTYAVEEIAPLTPLCLTVSDCRIVVYKRAAAGSKVMSIDIVSLPTCEVVYSQPVDGAILAQDYTSQLSVHYISAVDEGQCRLTSVDLISFQSKYEMMVSKQLYDEALMFAKENNLDTQMVYEARAKSVSHSLSPQTVGVLGSCLEHISDTHRVVDICVQSGSPAARIVREVLRYALKRLEVPQHASCTCDRMRQILSSLHRLGTFTQSFPSNHFSTEGWRQFLNCELRDEVLRLSGSESMPVAMNIWTRHKGELATGMSIEWLDALLSNLTTSLDYMELLEWLVDHMIPVVSGREEGVGYSSALTRHVERLARDYELSDKENWPNNSLSLCSIIDRLKLVSSCSSFNRLKVLRENLEAIKELKEVYSCPLSYSVYCEQSRESIVYRLLDVVDVPSVFRRHYECIVIPYMTQYSINSDKSLRDYVQDLIGRYRYVRGYDSTGLLWEQKAVAVIESLSVPSYRLKAVTELAKHCQVPWSKCISDIVDTTCQLSGEDVDELNSIRKRSLLSHLLSTYNVAKEIIPGPKNAEMLVRYILKESSTSLNGIYDALQVAKALLVEDWVVYRFACHNRLWALEDISDIVDDMPSGTGRQVLTRLLGMCVCIMDTEHHAWPQKMHWTEVAIRLLNSHQALIDESFLPCSKVQLSRQLSCLINLKKEFDADIKLSELSSPTSLVGPLMILMEKFVLAPVESRQGDKAAQVKLIIDSLALNLWRLLRFTHLASLPKSSLYQCIYDGACRLSPLCLTKILRLLLEEDPCSDSVTFVIGKLESVFTSGACSVDNAKELYRLAESCAARCTDEELINATRILSVARYHYDVMRNCLGGEDEQDVTSSEIDKTELETSLTRKHYNEKDLIISTRRVSEEVAGLMSAVLSSVSNTLNESPAQYTEILESLYGLLTSHSHDLLALRTCLLVYYSPVCTHISNPGITKLRQLIGWKLKSTIDSLLIRLFSPRNLDVHLTLSALLDLHKNNGLTLIKKNVGTSGSQYLRILSLGHIALVLCHTSGQLVHLPRCLGMQQEAIWGYMLSKCGVSFQSVFAKNNKGDLLNQITRMCSLEVTRRYISDFSLETDSERTYLSRIQHLIGQHNQTEFCTSSTSNSSLILEIKSLLPELPAQKELVESLVECSNPYNYSLIQALLSSSLSIPGIAEKQKLLDFLSVYRRHAPPSTFEVSYIKDYYPNMGEKYIPAVAYNRLPYHPLVEGTLWKTIRSELSVKTFKSLEPLTSILEIKTDVFMLNVALQIAEVHVGVVRQRTKCSGDADVVKSVNWFRYDDIDSKFFDDTMTVLAAIQDKKSAVMCSQALIEKVPAGIEKLLVTKLCMDLTRGWSRSLSQASDDYEVAESLLRKVTTMHTLLSVEQCLNQYNLASDRLLHLMDQPTHLIQAILETTHTDSSRRAEEKFEACCKLADVTGRDITKLCYNIVSDSWLAVCNQSTQASTDMDMTMTIDMDAMMSAAAAEELTNKSAADYEKEKWIVNLANSTIGHKIVHLLNSILNNISTGNKTKLLVVRCLLMLSDTSLANPTNQRSPSALIQLPYEELRRQHKALSYTTKLQQLNIIMTVDDFYSCDLSALIVKLRKNYSCNPTAIDLYADLCVETDRYDVTTWKILLHQLIELRMVDKLSQLLPACSGQTQLWCLDIYRKAWQLIADSSNNSVCKTALLSCPITERLQIHDSL